MEKVKFSICIVLCMASIVAGCSRPFKTPTVIPKTAEFKGIDTLQKESKAVSLITIHPILFRSFRVKQSNKRATLQLAGSPWLFPNENYCLPMQRTSPSNVVTDRTNGSVW